MCQFIITTHTHIQTNKPTDRNEEFFDLFKSMAHAGIGLSRWSKHLDEDVQVFVQVMIFGLATLPQLLLLRKEANTKLNGERNANLASES